MPERSTGGDLCHIFHIFPRTQFIKSSFTLLSSSYQDLIFWNSRVTACCAITKITCNQCILTLASSLACGTGISNTFNGVLAQALSALQLFFFTPSCFSHLLIHAAWSFSQAKFWERFCALSAINYNITCMLSLLIIILLTYWKHLFWQNRFLIQFLSTSVFPLQTRIPVNVQLFLQKELLKVGKPVCPAGERGQKTISWGIKTLLTSNSLYWQFHLSLYKTQGRLGHSYSFMSSNHLLSHAAVLPKKAVLLLSNLSNCSTPGISLTP